MSTTDDPRQAPSARAAGILLHPTSLPGPHGIGDLGPAAERFLDWAAAAGQSLWQVLPLGPTGGGSSPYTSASTFAGNPLLISPERLVEDGLLDPAELENGPRFPPERVHFSGARDWKDRLLRSAWEHFEDSAGAALRQEFSEFVPPAKREKDVLERMPMRKLAAGLRKQLLRKLKDKDPDLKIGKLRKE